MNVITIGRNAENRIVINDSTQVVSGNHGELKIADDGSIYYADNSRNGTMVNGRKVHHAEVAVTRNVAIVFPNGAKLNWNDVPAITPLANVKRQVSIGKNSGNDIQLYADNASRYHAVVKITGGNKFYIFDQSLNGTTVNGTPVPKYTNYEVKRGDKIMFAQREQLDWAKITGRDRRPLLLIIILLLLAIGSGGIYAFYSQPKKVPISLSQRYENSVCLIYHEYYLAYTDRGDTLYYIGENGIVDVRADPNGKDTLKAISVSGTGFYASSTGKIITNRHVATPWGDDNDAYKDSVEQRITRFRISRNEIPQKVKMVGLSRKLGIFVNNDVINKNALLANLHECKFLRYAPESEIDLAVIQLTSYKTPLNCPVITDIIENKDEIKVDDDVTLMGYPGGFGLALNNSDGKIKATSNHGKISKISGKYEVQYDIATDHGASGSPVFNKDQKLVAVHYAGREGKSGYSFGIIGVYIRKLLED